MAMQWEAGLGTGQGWGITLNRTPPSPLSTLGMASEPPAVKSGKSEVEVVDPRKAPPSALLLLLLWPR